LQKIVETKPWQQSLKREFRTGVARWHISKPKISIWVDFGGCFMAIWSILLAFWYVLWPFGIDFMVVWYMFSRLGILYQ
jgi:hypothetical protein